MKTQKRNHNLPFRITILVAIWFLFAADPVQSQDNAVLYTGLNQSKGYVVGAPLAAAGTYRFEQDTVWTFIGPANPRISGIAFHPDQEDLVYLAAGNGVLRSVNGGKNWRIVTDWRVTETQDIDLDVNAPDNVYVSSAYGVWRSEDGGDTWIESNSGFARNYTQTIETDRTQANRLFAGTEGGIYLSTDGAKSWRRVSPVEIEIHAIQQSRADSDLWLAGAHQGGLLISRDGGNSWTRISGAADDHSIYSVALHPTNPDIMAAVGWNAGVLFSEDRGRTWSNIGNDLPVDNHYELTFDLNSPNGLLVATIENGLYWTHDKGASWQFAGMYGTLVFDFTWKE